MNAAAGEAPIEVVDLPGRDRGVVAVRPIAQGDTLDVSYVTVFDEDLTARIWPHWQHDIFFSWNEGHTLKNLAVVFGITSLVNHSTAPNAAVERRFEARLIRLYALRDIAAGEEILISYVRPRAFYAGD